MLLVFQITLPIFIVLALSYITGRLRKIDLLPIVDLSIYLLVPCLILSTMLKTKIILKDFLIIGLAAIITVIGVGILTFFIFTITKIKNRGLYLPIIFMNTANIGFPVTLHALGDEGLSIAILYSIVCSFFVYTLGVYIAAKKTNFKEIFRLPLIYAALIGIGGGVFNLTLPEIVFRAIKFIGESALPLQLIILGLSLSKVKITLFKKAIFASLLRFILSFLIIIIFCLVISSDPLIKRVIILESTMPSALFSLILAEKYKRDSELVASTVFVSTVLSFITIPIVLLLIT